MEKRILNKFGFEEIRPNLFRKKFYGMATGRQAMDFANKIDEDLRPRHFDIIFLTDKEMIIKLLAE